MATDATTIFELSDDENALQKALAPFIATGGDLDARQEQSGETMLIKSALKGNIGW